MLHIALCDDNPASIEILEKYFDILNDSTIDYDANSARTVRLFRNRRYIHSDLVVRVFCSKRYVFPLLL